MLFETVADAEMLPALPVPVLRPAGTQLIPGCCPAGSALLLSGGHSFWGGFWGKSHCCAGPLPRGTAAAGCAGRMSLRRRGQL